MEGGQKGAAPGMTEEQGEALDRFLDFMVELYRKYGHPCGGGGQEGCGTSFPAQNTRPPR